MRSPFDLIQEQIVRLKDQLQGVPRFERGRITSVDPLRVQLDGADTPLAGAPDNLAAWLGVGDYVQVMIYRHRATIIGTHHSVPAEWSDVLAGDWVERPLAYGWTRYGSIHPPTRFMRVGNRVHISGFVRPGNNEQIVQTTEEFKPLYDQNFIVSTGSGKLGRITVGADNWVRLVNGFSNANWVQLDGITYYLD